MLLDLATPDMIKSFISKYVSKYFTNINPLNVKYNIFEQTVDLYDISINPDFFYNIRSTIAHLRYKFSLIQDIVLINNLFIVVDKIPCFTKNEDFNYDLKICTATIIYKDFKIKILEVKDGEIKGLEIIYKKVKILTSPRFIKSINGYIFSEACINIKEIYNAFLDFSNSKTLEPKKLKILVEKVTINNLHANLREITISNSNKSVCNIKKIKILGMKFYNTDIKFEKSIEVKNDIFCIRTDSQHLNILIKKNILQIESQKRYNFELKSISNILQDLPRMTVNILFLNEKISFLLDKNIYKFKYNNFLEIESICIQKEIIINTVKFNEESNYKTDNKLEVFIDFLLEFINFNIVILNIFHKDLFIHRLVYLCNENLNEECFLINFTSTFSNNDIKYLEICCINRTFKVKVNNFIIGDIESLIKYYQNKENPFNFDISVENLQVHHKDITLYIKEAHLDPLEISLIFDLMFNNNFIVEDCSVKYTNNNISVEDLFINISDNIMHTVSNINPFDFFKKDDIKSFKSTLDLHIDDLIINVFNISNREVMLIFLSDIDLLYSEDIFKLNIKYAQIDNQEYFTKHPIIFKSVGDNFINLIKANDEIYIDVGNFHLVYNEFLDKVAIFKNFYKTNNNVLIYYNFKSFVINSIECTILYKYYANVKLELFEIKFFTGTLISLHENIYKFYKSKLTKKFIGLIFKNIKNNLYTKYVNLGYKEDKNLPVPWYSGQHSDYRLKYPMPMRLYIEKYNYGLSASFYIFNKMDDKYTDEVFTDGTYANIFYKNKLHELSFGNNCLILTNKRLLMSSKLNIKSICIDDISVKEYCNYFMIGDIKIVVENTTFISSLCKFLL